MPYRFHWESPETVCVEFYGEVTFTDALNATEVLYNDSRSDYVKNAFWDFSAINGFVVSEDDVSDMAAMDQAASMYMNPMRAAFIIRDVRLMELGEHYVATLVEMGCKWRNKLFCNMDDARRWAGSFRSESAT